MATSQAGGQAGGKGLPSPIYVVDDNLEMCRSLEALLSAYGFSVKSFQSPLAFLALTESLTPGVLLVDLRMEELSGLEVIRRLDGQREHFPAIMITAHGDVEIAVKAIKLGARDFIQKPFKNDVLLETIEHVAQELMARGEADPAPRDLLTGRERDVAERLAKGLSNKQIAYDLGISVRTVEMHRLRAMQRLGCKSFADLLRVLLTR